MKRLGMLLGLFLMIAVPCFALSGSGGGGGAAGPPTVSSSLQQPVMPIGTGTSSTWASGTTTGTIASPPNVANGDLEIVYLYVASATASAFTPPASWSAIASCASQGNGVTVETFSHTASSEGGTIAAFTWITSAAGAAYAAAYRNATVDVCAASTAAAATTFTTAGITAAATTDRVVAAVGQPGSGGNIFPTTLVNPGGINDVAGGNGNGVYAAESFPITNTTVSGVQFTAGSAAWAGVMIGLAFSSSTTAGPPGALTYNQSVAYLQSLALGSISLNSKGTATVYSLLLPSGAAIGFMSNGTIGYAQPIISTDANSNILLGNALGNGTIKPQTNIQSTTNSISTTTASITTSTGAIGTTGGGIINTTGGAAPTITCSGGSTGTSVTAGSTNNRGEVVTSSSASTNCTITWSAAATWPQAPFCVFGSAGATVTPVAFSAGACGTSTCVFDFASATSLTVHYVCM